MSSDQVCRWGILGTAVISQKNWKSIRNSGNGVVTAVASRNRQRATDYIQARQAECSFPSTPEACTYEELLNRDDVDAVYIPLPTGLRKEWVIRAARAGKHVMCEKPCASSVADLEEMLHACRENHVQFMDGVMYMHSSRLNVIRDVLNDGTSVGELKRIATQFSFRAPDDFLKENIRVSSELEPFGCLGDLGWYCIRFALWVQDFHLPKQVTGRLLASHGRPDSPDSVPMEFSGELLFDGGVSSSFYCSFLTEHQQWAHISGSKGYLSVTDFVLPWFGSSIGFDVVNNVFDVNGCEFNMEHHRRHVSVREYSNSTTNSQETNLFRNFSELVLSGKPDDKWSEIALQTQLVMEACLSSARNGSQPVDLP